MGPQGFAPFCPWVGGVLALLCLGVALRANRRRRWVDDTPMSKTTGVFIGLVEVQGTAEAEQPLMSHLAEQPCVYYAWSVEESWSRTVTETYTDGQGKTQTRTRHESGWTAVAQGQQQTAFYLKDDLGVVLVHPEGAKIEPATIFSQTCRRGDPLVLCQRSLERGGQFRSPPAVHGDGSPPPQPAVCHGPGAGTCRRHCSGDRPRSQGPHVPDLLPDREADQPGLAIGYWAWAIVGLALVLAGIAVGRAAGGGVCPRTRRPISPALRSTCWLGPWGGSGPSSIVSWACATASVRRGPSWTCK